MYTVYAEGPFSDPPYEKVILHSDILRDQGRMVFNPKVTLEINKAGNFSFDIYPSNELYGSLSKLTTIITVYDDEEEIFRGRILHDDLSMDMKKEVYCEGEMSFLLDSIIRPYDLTRSDPTPSSLFRHIINTHNSQVEQWKQFEVATTPIHIASSYTLPYSSTDYVQTFEFIQELVESTNSMIRIRNGNGVRYIDWTDDHTGTSYDQTIEFASNLIDITEQISAEEVFTVLLPLGPTNDDQTMTISSVNNGNDYISASNEIIEKFGKICKIVSFDKATDPANLKAQGMTYMQSMSGLSVTIDANAIDLHLVNKNIRRINLGTNIKILSRNHGIDYEGLCTKIDIDLSDPSSSQYTFGHSKYTMSDINTNNVKNFKNNIH